MSSVLRSVRKRKKGRTLGAVDVIEALVRGNKCSSRPWPS